MSAVNSGIATKSCVYDFTKDGALGAGAFAFAGITLKPGEVLLDIKVTKFDNFASAGGGATTFSLGFGPNPLPGAFFTPAWQDTIASLNTYVWALHKGNGITTLYDQAYNQRVPSIVNASSGFWFTSSSALTSGRCAFYITLGYAKFT